MGLGTGVGSGVCDGVGITVGDGVGVGVALGVGVGVGVGVGCGPALMSKSEPVASSAVNKRPPDSDDPISTCARASVLVDVVPRTLLPTAALTLSSPSLIVITFPLISPKSAVPSVC